MSCLRMNKENQRSSKSWRQESWRNELCWSQHSEETTKGSFPGDTETEQTKKKKKMSVSIKVAKTEGVHDVNIRLGRRNLKCDEDCPDTIPLKKLKLLLNTFRQQQIGEFQKYWTPGGWHFVSSDWTALQVLWGMAQTYIIKYTNSFQTLIPWPYWVTLIFTAKEIGTRNNPPILFVSCSNQRVLVYITWTPATFQMILELTVLVEE